MAALSRRFFVDGLAFAAVLMKGGNAESAETAEQIRGLARLIMAYCAANGSGPETESAPEAVLDGLIDRHIAALRTCEETRLPPDRQALIDLHGRLQCRKALRQARDFYVYASEDKLADAVLALLDEEIEAAKETKPT
jgi:hypothetical protein